MLVTHSQHNYIVLCRQLQAAHQAVQRSHQPLINQYLIFRKELVLNIYRTYSKNTHNPSDIEKSQDQGHVRIIAPIRHLRIVRHQRYKL